jgi:hypothetical protein
MPRVDDRDDSLGRALRAADRPPPDVDVEVAWADHINRMPAPRAATPVAAGRRPARQVRVIAVASTAFVVGVGVAIVALRSDQAAKQPSTLPAPNHHQTAPALPSETLAQRQVAKLLGLEKLPPSCASLSSSAAAAIERADTATQSGGRVTPSSGDGESAPVVTAQRDCVVGQGAAAAFAVLQHQAPAGSFWGGQPFRADGVRWEWWPTSIFTSEEDFVQVFRDGPKRALVSVTASVGYHPSRPASEQMPAGVTSARVAVMTATGRSTTVVVTGKGLEALESLLDGLLVYVGGNQSPVVAADAHESVAVTFIRGSGAVMEASEFPALQPTGVAMTPLRRNQPQITALGRSEPSLDDPYGSLWQLGESLAGIPNRAAIPPEVVDRLAATYKGEDGPATSMTVLKATQGVLYDLFGGGSPNVDPSVPVYVIQISGHFQPNVPAPPGAAVYGEYETWAVTQSGLQSVGGFGCSRNPLDLASVGPTLSIPLPWHGGSG